MEDENSKVISGKKLLISILLGALAMGFVVIISGFYINLPEETIALGFAEVSKAVREKALSDPLGFRPIDWDVAKQWMTISGTLGGFALLFILSNQKENKRHGEEYGSANWMSSKGKAKYKKKFVNKKSVDDKERATGNGNKIFSQNIMMSNDGRKTGLNNNEIVIGGSGTGKSRFYVKPNLLQANGSYVVTDPAGELLHDTGKFLEEQGYKVKSFNLVEMEKSSGYNPFNYIRDEKDVSIMIDTLIANTDEEGASKGDGFWRAAERGLIFSLASYLIETYPILEDMSDEQKSLHRKKQSIPGMLELLNMEKVSEDENDDPSELASLMNELEMKDPESMAVSSYKIFSEAAPKTAMSILATTRTRMNPFSTARVLREMLREDELDLESIGNERTALFIIIPVANKTYNFLVSMLYSQLFDALYNKAETQYDGGMLPIQVNFYLDEFANIGKIPEFPEKLSTVRKYGLNVKIILQSISQLKAMYKDHWEGIIDNCDVMIYLGGNGMSTHEYVSKKLGKQTITQTTSSRSYSRTDSRSANKGLLGRELMTSDEVGKLSNKDTLVMIRSLSPIKDRKFNYPKHHNYKYTADHNKANKFSVDKRVFAKPTEPLQEVPIKKYSFMKEFTAPEIKSFNEVLVEDMIGQTQPETYYFKSGGLLDRDDIYIHGASFKDFILELEGKS